MTAAISLITIGDGVGIVLSARLNTMRYAPRYYEPRRHVRRVRYAECADTTRWQHVGMFAEHYYEHTLVYIDVRWRWRLGCHTHCRCR